MTSKTTGMQRFKDRMSIELLLRKKAVQEGVKEMFSSWQVPDLPHSSNGPTPQICILVGQAYLIKALALYHSLMRNSDRFTLWICCVDALTFRILSSLSLKNVQLLQVEEIEDNRLREVKKVRKINEYCWTLKAPLIEYLLENRKLETVLYCDGDIYFFSDPAAIYEEWGTHSVYLCPQRDAAWVEQKYGKYQAGMIGFRNDWNGLSSVKWWKEQCLNWCSAEPDGNRFGDQKYLDELPVHYSNFKVSTKLGINAAPWNCIYNNNYPIRKTGNQVYIKLDRLVAYHFACVKIYNEDEFDLWSLDHLTIPSVIKNEIYAPYLDELAEIMSRLKELHPAILRFGLAEGSVSDAKTPYKRTPLAKLMDQWNDFYSLCTIVSETYLPKVMALYHSLERHQSNFRLWICCVDGTSFETLQRLSLKNATVFQVENLMTPELNQIRQERTLQEFCWTLKASLCLYLLDQHQEIDRLIYCDADLYFFGGLKPIYDEWGKHSIFMCPQRGTPELMHQHGQYQAGLIGFAQEKNSRTILTWWMNKCLAWCYDRYDTAENRWGDQKYLDQVPHLFSNIKLVNHIGINAAPWNLVLNNNQYSVSRKKDIIYVEKAELVVFHFGSLAILNENEFDLWKLERVTFHPNILQYVYQPYIQELQAAIRYLKQLNESWSGVPKLPQNPFRLVPPQK